MSLYRKNWGVCKECSEVLMLRGNNDWRGEHKPDCPLKAAEDLIHKMVADPNTVIDMQGLDRSGKCFECGCEWISREDSSVCPDCGSSNIEEQRQ